MTYETDPDTDDRSGPAAAASGRRIDHPAAPDVAGAHRSKTCEAVTAIRLPPNVDANGSLEVDAPN